MVQQFKKENSKRFEITEEEESVGENVERFLGVKFGCDSAAAMKATDNWYKVCMYVSRFPRACVGYEMVGCQRDV